MNDTPPPLTPLGVGFDALAAAEPDAPAVTFLDVTRTRDQMARRSNQLARRLQALGVKTGDLVTIGLPNGPEFYEATLATWKLGAVPQPVSYRLPPAELTAVIDVADPAAVIGLPPPAAPADPPSPAPPPAPGSPPTKSGISTTSTTGPCRRPPRPPGRPCCRAAAPAGPSSSWRPRRR